MPTHFIRRVNMREQLIRQVEIIPIEVVIRNVAAGSLSKRLGIEEGTQLPRTIIEYYYKDDALGDPMVADEHIACFGWASQDEMNDIADMAIRVNDFMCGMFAAIGIRLVDFKLEFGRVGTATSRASSLPTKSAPTAAACGTSKPTRRWTRTASARTSAGSRKPIRKSPGGSACCSRRKSLPSSTSTATGRSAASSFSPRGAKTMKRARVVTLNAALGPLDYRVPDGMRVEPGSVVVAPLGPRQLIGVAWEADRLKTEEIGDNRLRPLASLLDVRPLAAPLRRLCEWTADYYLSPLASVLRMVLPSAAALDGPRQLTEYRPTEQSRSA